MRGTDERSAYGERREHLYMESIDGAQCFDGVRGDGYADSYYYLYGYWSLGGRVYCNCYFDGHGKSATNCHRELAYDL